MIAQFAAAEPLAALVAILAPILGIAARLTAPAAQSARRWIGILAMSGALVAAIVLAFAAPIGGTVLRADRLAALMAMLIAASAAAAAWTGGAARLRELACVAALMTALLADSALATWLGVHAAVVLTARGGWSARLPAMVGSATALAGTTLLGGGAGADITAQMLGWSALAHTAAAYDGGQLSIAVALMLAGYGLAALHTPPVSVPALGIVAVVTSILLRMRALLAANSDAIAPGPLFMAAGLVVAIVTAAALWTRRDGDERTLIALASAGQVGLALCALGLGGRDATTAGLLHLTMIVLAASSAFCGAGRARTASVAALALLPPFGPFASAALMIAAAAHAAAWLVVPLAVLLVALGLPLIARLGAEAGVPRSLAASVPAWLALSLTVLLGLFMPAPVATWLQAVGSGLP